MYIMALPSDDEDDELEISAKLFIWKKKINLTIATRVLRLDYLDRHRTNIK